jgi:GNAT superfamily N-acetyltransferase
MSAAPVRIALEVPAHLQAQLVYRMERTQPYAVAFPQGYAFVPLLSVGDALVSFALLKNAYGLAGAAKAVLKLATARRFAYLVHKDGAVVSTGWCMLGQSKFYDTEASALTIGPIETSESVRGLGLATLAIQAAINAHIVRGCRVFYIDTHQNNLPAQRVFAKCGWGTPVGAYLRNLPH